MSTGASPSCRSSWCATRRAAQSLGRPGGPDVRPVALRCEHRHDVPCIEDPSPRLGWALESPERAKRQTAYRILVSDNLDDLEQCHARLWDSGRVESSSSVDIVYAGR